MDDYLATELEFRASYILQEAALLARHARRSTVSAADVALAHLSLCGGHGGGGAWSQHPGSAGARLLLSAGAVRTAPLGAAALLGGAEGEGGGAAALAGSREAAATLAAVTAALGAALASGSAEEFSGLLSGLAGQHGLQLARLMPAVVSSLRAALEGLLLAPALAGGGGGGGGAPDARQLHCLLHIVAGVTAHRGLPVEDCSGELLALLASLLLHRDGGAAGEAADAAARGQQLRELAADVFADFVERVAVQWPQVTEQAVALLLDAAVDAAIVREEAPGGAAAASPRKGSALPSAPLRCCWAPSPRLRASQRCHPRSARCFSAFSPRWRRTGRRPRAAARVARAWAAARRSAAGRTRRGACARGRSGGTLEKHQRRFEVVK